MDEGNAAGMPHVKRNLFRALTLALMLAVVTFVALPVWFPWVFRSVGSRYGLDYSGYERLGYQRFALLNVHTTQNGFEFTALRSEAYLPPYFLWQRYVGATRGDLLKIQGWKVRQLEPTGAVAASTVPKAENPSRRAQSLSPAQAVARARDVVGKVSLWLPRARLTEGAIELRRARLTLPSVVWSNRVLSAQIKTPFVPKTTDLQMELPPDAPWLLRANSRQLEVSTQLSVFIQTRPLRIEGDVSWRTNHFVVGAELPADEWLPERASVRCASFSVPAPLLNLRGYEDLAGALEFVYENARFNLRLNADAKPLAEQPMLFPVTASIKASGSTNVARLEKVVVRAPWLEAALSRDIEVDYTGKLLTPEAVVEVSADLGKQPWFNASGLLQGQAVLRPSERRYPVANFSLAGNGVEYSGVRADSIDLQGNFTWPSLEVKKAEARFEEGTLNLTAQADLGKQVLSNGVLHFEGKLPSRLEPPRASYRRLRVHANLDGPFRNPHHNGGIEIHDLGAQSSALLNFQAKWHGRGTDLDEFSGTLASPDSVLTFGGAATGEPHPGLRLDQLTLMRTNVTVYQLERSFSVSLARESGEGQQGSAEWLLNVEPVHWFGPGHELSFAGDVAWPRQGRIQFVARSFDTSAFDGFFANAPPSIRIDHLEGSGQWTNGPIQFNVEAKTRFFGRRGLSLEADVAAHGATNGVTLSRIELASHSFPVVSAKGRLPITIEPGRSNRWLRIDQQGKIEIQARTLPNEPFWRQVTAWTKVGFVDPRMELSVTGSLSKPQARVLAQIASVHSEGLWTNRELPRVERVFAEIDASRTNVRVDNLAFSVEGQSVKVACQVPLGSDLSANWREFFQWNQATGRVQIAPAQIAAFARFAPTFVSPQGELRVDVAVRPQWMLDGKVIVTGAATRPLPSIGPLNGLESQLKLTGRKVELETCSALIGGEPFSLTGELDFGMPNPTSGLPTTDLRLNALGISLARRPDLILRSDLDLRIAGGTNGPPVVSGSVRLRDSVFLSDLRVLIPGKIAQPRQRPPFFSVDVEPLASFELDVRVTGDRFLKVRSPFFRGELSANLTLGGTLRTPISLGEVTVNSGTVQFPFANLEVTQGLVTLSSADPYRPQLFFTAGARALGYDVRMEVSGKADAPVIQFTSIPPLNSEQVLLMLTSGEMPNQSSTVSTQQRASRLALFLGKNLLSQFSSGEGGADRLTIRSGEYVSDRGKQTYSLEYRLNKDWSIVGEYDRFGAFNADLKWRVYSH